MKQRRLGPRISLAPMRASAHGCFGTPLGAFTPAICSQRQPEVFDVHAGPWIKLSSADAVAATIPTAHDNFVPDRIKSAQRVEPSWSELGEVRIWREGGRQLSQER